MFTRYSPLHLRLENAAGDGSGGSSGAPAAPPAGDQKPAGQQQPAPPPLSEDQRKLVENAEMFKARLAEERDAGAKALLKTLGFDKPDDLKATLKAAKDAEDAKKTELQKLQERASALEPKAALADEYAQTIGKYAEAEFKALPEEAQKLVTAQAGEDPHGRLKTIAALRESGVLAKLAPAQAVSQAANTRAGTKTPPAPAGNQQKHPRDMSPEEYRAFEAESLARHSRPQ